MPLFAKNSAGGIPSKNPPPRKGNSMISSTNIHSASIKSQDSLILGENTSIISSLGAIDSYAQELSDEEDAPGLLGSQSRTSKKSKKLDMHSIPVTGRSKEVALLVNCYMRVANAGGSMKNSKSEVVLISGESGTGKSKLAGVLREPVTMQSNGFFVSGKFDHLRKDPYSALVEAFTDLCDLVAQQEENECASIADALKEELTVLNAIIPNLSRITGTTQYDDVESVFKNSGTECFTRFKLSCRKFLNVVASRKHPVVLLLDDLQWADESSMDLIRALVTDKESAYLLIIGTFRDPINEIESRRVESLVRLLSESKEHCLPNTFIKLESFGLDQIVSLLSAVLEIYPSKALELAELILKRTSGLPFFVVKFIEMLGDQEHLQFDTETDEWMFSISGIQSKTAPSKNVVDVVTARVRGLQRRVQAVLRLAAVQGFRFDPSVIAAIAEKEMESIANIAGVVKKALKSAEEQGMIEGYQDGSMRFCHDRIHECLYSMIPHGKRLAILHLSVARILQGRIENETFVFSIVDHLKLASQMIATHEDKLACAKCNLRATKLAMKKSAFVLAAEYACDGLAWLDSPLKWDENCYETTLALHGSAAEAYNCFGDVERCNKNLEEIFRHGLSFDDKIWAYTIKVHSLGGAQARLDEAVDVAFFVARQLGVKIPKKPNMRNAVWQIIRTKILLAGKTDKQLLSIVPDCAVMSRKRQAFVVLGIASNYASLAMKIPHLCLAIVSMLQISIREQAPEAAVFASYGILETVMGNISGGVRMGELAIQLQGVHGDPRSLPATLAISHTFLSHWRAHQRESLQPLLKAYRLGMEIGDFNDAFLAIQSYMQSALYGGSNLVELEKEMRHYCQIIVEFDNKSISDVSLPYWQICLNFLGQNANPTFLTGEAMEQASLVQDIGAFSNTIAGATIINARIQLCYHFGDVQSLTPLLVADSIQVGQPGHLLLPSCQFYYCLAFIELYRGGKQRSYKKKAQKIIKQMQKWTNDGCINTKPLLAILDAEMATLVHSRSVNKIDEAFGEAILEARTYGNVLLEALANERAARYLQCNAGDKKKTKAAMNAALECYASWGATAKINYLRETTPWLKFERSAAPREILAVGP